MAEKKKGLFSKKPSAPAEMKPTPRKQLAGYLADALINARNFADRARVPESVPLVGGQGLGSMFLGQAPEEVNEMSYGNSPIQMNPYAGRTASFVPEMKRGRGAQVFDAISLLSLPGARTVAGGLFGGGLTPGVDAAATVWHGSPHKFPPAPNNPLGEFDFSKIGTGEGVQAYGQGGYLADAQGVAQGYRNPAGNTAYTIDGKNAIDAAYADRTLSRPVLYLQDFKGDIKAAMQSAIDDGKPEIARDIQKLSEAGRIKPAPEGYLYKVDLPDNAIAKMLDWDKPLSQQAPEVQAALTPEALGLRYEQLPNGNHAFVNKQGTRVGNMQKGGTPDSFRTSWLNSVANGRLSGREVYQSINDGMFGADKAAAALRQAGIPGIRYLDGGSRSAGQGTSNYVVFPGNESLLTILERNGQVAAPTYRDPFGNTIDETIR